MLFRSKGAETGFFSQLIFQSRRAFVIGDERALQVSISPDKPHKVCGADDDIHLRTEQVLLVLNVYSETCADVPRRLHL